MITVQLVGGPLDGLEMEIPAPPAVMLYVQTLPEWSLEEAIDTFGQPVDTRIPVPVQYRYRRLSQVFLTGCMVRYRWTGR